MSSKKNHHKERIPLSKYNPELLQEWNYKRNTDFNPKEIYHGSNTKVWWICIKGHEWKDTVDYRSRGFGKCRQCKSLKLNHPETWNELHPNLNEEFFKNGKLSKYTLSTSPLIVWWLGKDCQHTWDMPIRSRVRDRQNCPYCSNQRVLEGFNDLATTKPELLQYWDIRNKIKPTEITYGSKKVKIIWTNKCGHTWATTPNHRIKVKNDYCPKCLLLVNDSPWLTEYFRQDLNTDIKFHELKRSSEDEITWNKRDCNHTWTQKVFVINTYNEGYCKVCTMYKSKGESELSEFISQTLPKGMKAFNNHRGLLSRNKEIDIYIPELKLAIEYNGEYYHSDYHQKKGKSNYVSFSEKHRSKFLECASENISLIFVWESDWMNKQEIVKTELQKIISKALEKPIVEENTPEMFKRLVSIFDM